MRTKPIGSTLLFCFLATAACFAADPQIGTWKLNEAQSKFTPGTTKQTMVVYQPVGDQVKITVEGVQPNGKTMHGEWTGKFDGRDYPVVGDPNQGARAYKRRNDRTLEMTITRRGFNVGNGRIVVSPDGKSRTVTVSGRDAKGKHFNNKAVYDRQ